MKGLDVRAVANIVLEEAKSAGVPMSNLHLNKTLFFMHVDCLRDRGQNLVSAKIEAWEYGPVFREIYNQFKRFKKSPISENATKVDFDSGELVEAWADLPNDYLEYIKELARFYIHVPVGMLVDVSHAKGGAWDCVWNSSGPVNVGMEITEDLIRQYELPVGRRIKLQ